MNTGYFPGVASIGNKIVYIGNRDGNANVKTVQEETLELCYTVLNNNKIYVNRSRMDAGSYSEKIIKVVDKYSKLFLHSCQQMRIASRRNPTNYGLERG